MHHTRLLLARHVHDIEGEEFARYPGKVMFRCISIFSPTEQKEHHVSFQKSIIAGEARLDVEVPLAGDWAN